MLFIRFFAAAAFAATCTPLGAQTLTIEEAQQRLAAQLPLAEKEKHADILIHNDGPLVDLQKQVDQLLKQI